jgi:hypothetical protein
MGEWQPHREPLRVTLTRTFGIALVGGALVAPWAGGVGRWPLLSLLLLWPAFGGHWIDLFFLNWCRPRLPRTGAIQRFARIAVWFGGGVVLALGVRQTARLALERPSLTWFTWARAGALFVVIELVAHAVLYIRGRPSFYDGLG